MILGTDIDTPESSSCQAREWSAGGCAAGILLTATGTPMAPDAICDGIKPALDYASTLLRTCLENIASGAGSEDLVYAGTKLLDCCEDIHNRVLEIQAFAGQGIYLGGVIAYFAHSQFLHIPFGGGCLYSVEDGSLKLLGALPDTHLIRDAIGGSQVWKGVCRQDPRKRDMRLIFTSSLLKDPSHCEGILAEHSNEQSHMNTASMLLRRELTQEHPGSPTAVMEMRL